MEEEIVRGGDGPNYEPYRLEAPPISGNGHVRRRPRSRIRLALRGAPAGLLVTGLLATSIVPSLHVLNLAFFNPWPRPVLASGLGGLAAGVSRRGRGWTAPIVGAVAATAGLWAVYGMARAQTPVLFVDRSVARVVLADLARLAAYAVPAGALGGAVGRVLRALIGDIRARRARPITALPPTVQGKHPG